MTRSLQRETRTLSVFNIIFIFVYDTDFVLQQLTCIEEEGSMEETSAADGSQRTEQFAFPILKLIHQSQSIHGLKHSEYSRYRYGEEKTLICVSIAAL